MKILKIKALNINSLKGELEIDFHTFLNDNALFAITGPTGSGKSTILDIITCALYGRTPRLKNPNELMSRHTGESLCEVEFEIKGIIYRSSWTQKRARKNANGKFQSAKMELSDVATSKVIKSTLRDVPKYVEELSGLDFDRFKQSMVLAQGGFDAFLKADEKERSTLLEKMTGTQIYREISLEIFNRHKAFETDINLDKNILESTQLLDIKEVEDKTKALEENRKEKLAHDIKEKELIQIKTWLETLAQLETDNIKYTDLFTSISKEKEDNKESFTKLLLANKAQNVEVLYTKHNTLEASLQKDETNHKQLLINLEDSNKLLKSQDSVHTAIVKDTSKAKEHFDAETKKIKEVRTLETQIAEKQKSLDVLINHIQTNQDEYNTYTKDLESLSSVYVSIDDKAKVVKAYIQSNSKDEKLIELLPLVKKNIEEYSSHNTSLRDIHESQNLALKEQSLQESSVELIDKESKDLKAIYEYINKTYTQIQADSTHDSIEEDRLRVQVKKQESLQKSYIQHIEYKNKISNELESKASQVKEQLSLKQSMQTKQALVNELKVHIQTLREKKDTELLIKKYEEDRARLKEGEECFLCGSSEHPYIRDAQNSTIVDTDKTINLIKQKEQVLSKEEDELTTQGKSLTQIESKIESINLEVKKLAALKTLQQSQANTKTTHENFIKEQKDKSTSILNIANIDLYETEVNTSFKTIQDKENLLSKELTKTKAKEVELKKQEKHLKELIESNKLSWEQLKQKLDVELKTNNFEDIASFKKAILPKEQREELSLICKSIDEKYNNYKTLQKDTQEKLQEHKQKEIENIIKNKPIDEVAQELQALQVKIDELQENIGALSQTLKRNEQDSQKHQEKIQQLEKKKEAFKVWVKLNEMIGSADGNKFAKFAQGITLDQLISLANNHLILLSSRYELQRSTVQKQLLEIEVVDSFQGNVLRPVSTLSGGESFIVSLSLALGLSELASQKIAIDSLFLDEGFGTLDEDSLETALNALNLLQSRGKMVGVISHVEALKERIPLQIKVVPKGDGTSFVEIGN